MNNTQFRRLVLDTPTASGRHGLAEGQPLQRGPTTPSALGSRLRSSIPMTPRSIAGSSGNDFARQLAERNAELHPSSVKKFRSSAAPKGTKLRAGYQDRTQLRTSGEEDEKATRVKALEDMVKLGQIEPATFESLRDEIIGGDVKDVHLVKGLDYKLLERVRRGEDVLAGNDKQAESERQIEKQDEKPEEEIEDELDELEEREVQPIIREEKPKKGEMAPPPQVAGKKRARDDILKELKASRLAAAEEAKARQPNLGARFTRVGARKETSRIEKDDRGREILITVDAEGNVKRKVRKAQAEDSGGNDQGLLMPDRDVAPLGMAVVPIAPPPTAQEDDAGDIFEGVGVDYNPLGDAEEEDDSDDSNEETKASMEVNSPNLESQPKSSEADTSSMPRPPLPSNAPGKRNYFNDSTHDKVTNNDAPTNPLTDPTILAALKRASAINPVRSGSSLDNEEEAAKLARRKKMLDSHDRDADDMDMGFGSSRFEDEEDGDGKRVKLSVWGEEGGDEEGKGDGKSKRKRGIKKRKGEGNSAADVLKAMERRKGEKT